MEQLRDLSRILMVNLFEWQLASNACIVMLAHVMTRVVNQSLHLVHCHILRKPCVSSTGETSQLTIMLLYTRLSGMKRGELFWHSGPSLLANSHLVTCRLRLSEVHRGSPFEAGIERLAVDAPLSKVPEGMCGLLSNMIGTCNRSGAIAREPQLHCALTSRTVPAVP